MPPATTAPAEQAATTGVSYRVLKRGDGRIYTGAHTTDGDGKTVFETYPVGSVVNDVDPKIAAALEARDLVETVG